MKASRKRNKKQKVRRRETEDLTPGNTRTDRPKNAAAEVEKKDEKVWITPRNGGRQADGGKRTMSERGKREASGLLEPGKRPGACK